MPDAAPPPAEPDPAPSSPSPARPAGGELTEHMAEMRRSYELGGLDEADLAGDWLSQFRAWFADAERAGLVEPNAMVVATADTSGGPSARTVLCKTVDERGFVFYTNYFSRKGKQAKANHRVGLVFPWHPLQRQVMVTGSVERVPEEESDAYFASRPRGSQLAAWASPQSRVVADRAELEQHERDVARRFAGARVPRPPHWGGLLVRPDTVEFWQGRANRMHDRLCFNLTGPTPVRQRLAP